MNNNHQNICYVAALEILFLNKIHKLRNSIILKEFEQIRQLAAKYFLDMEEFLEQNYLLFQSADTRLNSLINISQFSLQLKKRIIDSKIFFEFNILIFKTHIDSKVINQSIRNGLLNISTDKKVWLLQEYNPVIHYNIHLSAIYKGMQEVIALRIEPGEKNFLEKCEEDILFYAIQKEDIEKAITNIHIQAIGVTGQINTGKTAFLRSLCRSDMQKFIYLSAHSQYQEASYPFIVLLHQLQEHFLHFLPEKGRHKLEKLSRQVRLSKILSYKQIEVDVLNLLCQLVAIRSLVLVCDHLDSWPAEAIELMQLFHRRLSSVTWNLGNSQAQCTFICSMSGVYYPIRIDELIHFSEQHHKHSAATAGAEWGQRPALPDLEAIRSCSFSAKEQLQAILLSQRVSLIGHSNFNNLLIEGLKNQEITIISIIQRFPYIFSRDILVKVLNNYLLYDVIDYLIDHYFLIEVEDHLGMHLFCTINTGKYRLELNISKSINEDIRSFFSKNMIYYHSDIYSLYILSINNILLYEVMDFQLYRMLEAGFSNSVHTFINSDIFKNYYPGIRLWKKINSNNMSNLYKIKSEMDTYSTNKKNIRFLLPLSNYYLLLSDYEKSLKINKEAIYLFNNDDNYRIYIDKIFYIYVKIFIQKCNFKEATEYINISMESLHNSEKSNLFYQFIYLRLLCLFFEKEFHSAIQMIEKYDFDEYLDLYGEIERYFEINLIIMRIYFEIGQYQIAQEILNKILEIAKYYNYRNFIDSIYCWIARISFYTGKFHQGFSCLEKMKDCEEKFYFLSEGFYFYDEKERALRSIMMALKMSLKKALDRKNLGNLEFDNVYSLQEGKLITCNGKKDPLLVNIQALAAYLHTFYGEPKIADKILKRIVQRPSFEFNPFQHIFHYFYYLYLKQHSDDEDQEELLYLSYAISMLQNASSKILNTKIRYDYIYNNYWNSMLAREGEQHNLLILGSPRSY